MNEANDEYLRAQQRVLLVGVVYILEEKADMYHKILRNGDDIWIQTTGERRRSIYELRNKLGSKILLIYRLENEIINKYY